MNRFRFNTARPRRGMLAAAALLLGASTALAACGSDSGSDSDASSAAGASGGSACTEKVAAEHEKNIALKDQDWLPTESPDASVVKGKSYWVIPLTSAIPTLADYAQGFKNAGDAVGADVTIFDGKANPAGITQGVSNAIAAKADAIVLILIDPKLIASAMKSAADAGIPVVLGGGSTPKTPFEEGVAAETGQNQEDQGRSEAIEALRATDCKLNAILVNSPGNNAGDGTTDGIQTAVKELCPDDCKIQVVGIQASEVATKTTSSVQNALRRDPSINVVLEIADVFTSYDQAAIKAVGSKAKIITSSSIGNLKGTGQDTLVESSTVYPPGLAHGWYYMQALINLADGQKDVIVPYPLGLVDESNRADDDPSSYSGASPFDGFEDGFKKLWGVAG